MSQSAFEPVRHFPEHMLAAVPSYSIYLKNHLETSVVYSPIRYSPVSDDKPSDVNKPITTDGRKKKMAKRNASLSKVKAKKGTKANGFSQQETYSAIQSKSGSKPTPPVHSSEVRFRVSISHAHSHGESTHNLPPSPKKDGVGIENSP